MLLSYACPVCNSTAIPLDVVDLNKSCENRNNHYLPLSGVPIYYYLCESCHFCFAPEIYGWNISEFEDKIYNAEYIQVDPEYADFRPRANAQNLARMFGNSKQSICHLDYGGGSGLLSQLLCEQQWQSISYDPFYNKNVSLKDLGKFDLITAYEVFEHVPDIDQLMSNLSSLIKDDGIILFSTLLSDGQIEKNKSLSWWYAAPRNGHISLFSKASLFILAKRSNFLIGSFSSGFHVMLKTVPVWAKHLINVDTSINK